jgi:hypothetical protein
VFVLDSLLVGGLRFVLNQIAAAAEAEARDESVLREQLLEAQMRLEVGEISEADYSALERDILARMREAKGPSQGALTMSSDTSVDVESYPTRD